MTTQTTEPVFTTDWLTNKLHPWVKHLTCLKDKPVKALEVGSYEGRSAIWLLQNVLTHKSSSIDCVDIWKNPEVHERFVSNTERYKNKVYMYKEDSKKVLPNLAKETYDIVYIDGDHSEESVLFDLVNGFALLKVGGIMIADDYLWRDPHGHGFTSFPKEAIDAFTEAYKKQIRRLYKGYQVIIQRTS